MRARAGTFDRESRKLRRVAILAMVLTCAIAGQGNSGSSPITIRTEPLSPGRREIATAPPPNSERLPLDEVANEGFNGRVPGLGATYALVVVQHGRIVYERYGKGITPETRLPSWSMAKSVTHALVGRAVMRFGLNIDRAMGGSVWRGDDPRSRISWRTWMQMDDGLRHSEFGATSFASMDAAHMLFGWGREDNSSFCAREPLVHTPETHWNYSSCAWVLVDHALSGVVAPNVAGPLERRKQIRAWMEAELFGPLGMESALVEFDATGQPVGSAWLFATARDYARFGLLYLHDGVSNGRRILPPGWVNFARTPGPAANSDGYGAGWWITPAKGRGRPRDVLIDTGCKRDAYSAQGRRGQVILVVPSKDLVIVRLGYFSDAPDAWTQTYAWMGRIARTLPVCAIEQPSAYPVSGEWLK